MVEIKNLKKYGSLEDLELSFFQVIDDFQEMDLENEKVLSEDKQKNFNFFIDESSFREMYKVIKILEGKMILISDGGYSNYYVINQNPHFEVGDVIAETRYKINDNETWIKLDKEIFNKDFLIKIIPKIIPLDYKIDLDKMKEEVVLNQEIVLKEIKELEARQNKEKVKEKKENTETEVKEMGEKEKWEKESVYEKNNGNKFDKKCYIDGTSRLRLLGNKNFNKIYDYDCLGNWGTNFNGVNDKLIKEELDFVYGKTDGLGNWKQFYKVEFGDNERKINGVNIAKGKINFIISRIKDETTKKNIELLNKLSGIKVDLLEKEKLDLRKDNYNEKALPLDIKFSLVDEKNFNMEFLGKTKIFNWDTLKGWFISGLNVDSSIKIKEIFKISKELELEKQDVYDYLKRVAMLQELDETK